MKKPPVLDPAQRALKLLQNADLLDQQAYDDLVALATQMTGASIGVLSLMDRDRYWFKSRIGTDLCELNHTESFCRELTLSTSVLEVSDASTDERFKNLPIVKSGLRFYAGVPLIFENTIVGSLCVLHTEAMSLSEAQRGSLQSLARMAVVCLEKAATTESLEESRATQGFLDLLIENNPNMIFVKNAADLKYVMFNRAGEQLTGFSREHLVGKSDHEIFPENADFYIARDREALSTKKVVHVIEEDIQTRLKGARILRTKKVPIFNEDGTPKYLLGISEDITEFRQAEEERDRFFTTSLDMLAISDMSGYFTRVSPVVQEILGYTPEEFCSIPYLDMIHPEDLERTIKEIDLQKDGGSVFKFVNRYRCKDGSYRWMSWKSTPVGDVMYGCGRDVTAEYERMHDLEERVAARTAELEITANRFKRVVSSNLIGIMFWKAGGILTEANDAFLSLIGYTRQDLEAGVIKWRNLTPREYYSRDLMAIEEIAKTGRCKPYEKEYIRKDGSRVSISIGAAKLDGEFDQGVGYVIDLTESKRLELERNALHLSAESAVAASQLKSEFLANMSHEIRTPINGILGMLGLLNDMNLSPDQREYAEAAKISADALLTVINDILDFSKVEAGKLEFEDIDFELPRFFEDLEKAFVFQARAKGVSMTLDLDPKLPAFAGGDPGRIKQVLNNLMSNAIKFTLDGEVIIRVTHEKIADDQIQIRVEITDTGIGISKDAVSRMFHAFAQADTSTTRKYGGTGLGLSISKHLIEKMKGEIGVESEEGEGSTFWFTLPLRIAEARATEKVIFSGTFAQSFERPLRVLIAEDNPINQKIALKQLEKMGLKADAVGNGKEVLEAMRLITYDLILMDCQMPEMDGYEATRMIRSSITLPRTDIPIVAMTANAMKGERERCLEAGMNDYISKPAKVDALFEVISRWLTA